jgi:hypothetical protein
LQLAGDTAELTFARNSAARGVTLIVESTTDFIIWTALATSVDGNPPTGPATITEGSGAVRTVTVRHSASPGRSFYRLRAVIP